STCPLRYPPCSTAPAEPRGNCARRRSEVGPKRKFLRRRCQQLGPHKEQIHTTRIFPLKVPAGYASAIFTHLPSRSVFIDSDRYVSDDSLGYWVAHELGHLAANSTRESDADKAAGGYRKRLKDAHKPDAH